LIKDLLCDGFQEAVEEYLVRHRSILDVLSKYQESSARVNRAVAKSVTSCGCIKISADKQKVPSNITLGELKQYMETHVKGNVCEHCKDVIEDEVGAQLFYMAALCNLLDINLYDVFLKEHKKIETLGIFNFS
jgi:hypothetical protein